MQESFGDRRKEVQEGARFIYFVKQLHTNLCRIRRLPKGSLSHEPVTFRNKSIGKFTQSDGGEQIDAMYFDGRKDQSLFKHKDTGD